MRRAALLVALLALAAPSSAEPDIYPPLANGAVRIKIKTSPVVAGLPSTASVGTFRDSTRLGCINVGPGITTDYQTFTIARAGTQPSAMLRARAFPAPDCQGDPSMESNAAVVFFDLPAAPVLLP